MVKISELQQKDVVNVANGKRLGNLGDIDINWTTGQIEAIIIIGTGKVLGLFGRADEMIIPWRDIVKVGADVILGRLDGDE